MTPELRHEPGHRLGLKDVVAGLSVAVVLIPQSMAYAELAGLPSHHGLYAAALAPIAASFLASSPYLQTGPVALTALLTLGALMPMATPASAEFVGLAALLAVVVGVVRIGVGLLRAGSLSYLMSRPMLSGFTSAAAILILATQIPGAVGSDVAEGGVLGKAAWALTHPGAWEWSSVVLSLGTVAVITVSRRIHPRVPGVLLAAVGGMVFSVATGYEGATVGSVPSGFIPLSLGLPWARLPSLVLPGTVIALVGFAEAASISRMFASEDRGHWSPDREFLGQGVANVVAGMSGGFPVGGSFSRSSLNRLAGAGSRWSGLVTGLSVLAFLPFASVLSPLPRAILAGIVIAAVWSLFKPRVLVEIWHLSRPQGVVAGSTFGLTLALSPHVEQAVLMGILTAGAVHLWKELKLEVRARREGDTLHMQPEGVLWFGSAPALDDALLECLAEEPGIDRVVLSLAGLGRIDLTGAYTLAELLQHIRDAGIEVDVEDVPKHVRRAFVLLQREAPEKP